MPSIRAAIERLRYEMDHGNANEPVHLVFVEREQNKRIKNPEASTRFVMECDDAQAYSELHAERDRIIKRARNKSVAISLMIRAWREGLSNAELDRLMAEEEGALNEPNPR